MNEDTEAQDQNLKKYKAKVGAVRAYEVKENEITVDINGAQTLAHVGDYILVSKQGNLVYSAEEFKKRFYLFGEVDLTEDCP